MEVPVRVEADKAIVVRIAKAEQLQLLYMPHRLALLQLLLCSETNQGVPNINLRLHLPTRRKLEYGKNHKSKKPYDLVTQPSEKG
jgi:hypothetical protein